MSMLIRNARVLTMDDDDTEFPRADILVRGTRIAEIGPDLDVSNEGQDLRVIPADNLLAMPGLVNGHFHSPATFSRARRTTRRSRSSCSTRCLPSATSRPRRI